MAIMSFLYNVPSTVWRKINLLWNVMMNNKIQDLKGMRDILYKASGGEKTFENEDQLPSLPVPTLKETLDKYLDSVRAVVTDEEYRKTEELVRNFENSDTAKMLQEKLEQRAGSMKNWLEQWWEDVAYLQQRVPLIPYSNMTGPQPRFSYWPPTPGSRIDRIALIISCHLSFWQLLRKEQLRPINTKGTKWSMNQFKRIYNTCRLPGEFKDVLVTPFKTENEGESAPTGIVLMYRGYAFAIDTFDEETGEPLTPPEIARQLRYVDDWCKQQPCDGPGIGALTVTDRTTWFKNREYLKSLHPDNAKFIDVIENCLMVFSFSDNEPVEQEEILKEAMFQNCEDRWADKSYTCIAYNNGNVAGNADHTPLDGLALATNFHYIILTLNDCNGTWTGPSSDRPLPEPVHLKWHVDEQINSQIAQAKIGHRMACDDIEVIYRTFTDYGRSVSAKHRLHPEAYFQAALQLAYYRMHKKPAPTYCTASTRSFYHGRTETCRSCFPEVVELARAFEEGQETAQELYPRLQEVCNKFQKVMTEACNGRGVDRHLLGLYLTALENGVEVPALYQDPSYVKSGGNGNFVLSTSCAGYWNICGSVPAMRPDGYSCFYGIEQHQYSITISCFKSCPETSAVGLYDSLTKALIDMRNVLESYVPKK